MEKIDIPEIKHLTTTHLAGKVGMKLLDEIGRQLMQKTSKELKSINMQAQKLFMPLKKVIEFEADGQPRELMVHEHDYVTIKINVRGLHSDLMFTIKPLDPHDRTLNYKLDLRVYTSTKSHHPNENNHDMAYL
jgi:helix-turn-helix protein